MQGRIDNSGAPVLALGDIIGIVGGGAIDLDLLAEAGRRGIPLVGADGGAEAIAAIGLTPVAIVGDLDSLERRDEWEQRTRVLHLPEQITIDFEKCVYASDARVILAFGMTGGRFDHTLAGLHVVARYAGSRRIVLIDAEDIALGVSGAFAFDGVPGERVSMHPLEPVRFASSRGLRYALDGLTLAPGVLTGVSNEASGGRYDIEPAPGETGAWLLIVPRARLWDLVAVLRNEA